MVWPTLLPRCELDHLEAASFLETATSRLRVAPIMQLTNAALLLLALPCACGYMIAPGVPRSVASASRTTEVVAAVRASASTGMPHARMCDHVGFLCLTKRARAPNRHCR